MSQYKMKNYFNQTPQTVGKNNKKKMNLKRCECGVWVFCVFVTGQMLYELPC